MKQLNITSIIRDAFSPLYDLQGRLLQGKPGRGIYIQNGKRYVVR